MIKADIPVALQLKKLYELQQIDSQINEFETLKGELPVEVSDLEMCIRDRSYLGTRLYSLYHWKLRYDYSYSRWYGAFSRTYHECTGYIWNILHRWFLLRQSFVFYHTNCYDLRIWTHRYVLPC